MDIVHGRVDLNDASREACNFTVRNGLRKGREKVSVWRRNESVSGTMGGSPELGHLGVHDDVCENFGFTDRFTETVNFLGKF